MPQAAGKKDTSFTRILDCKKQRDENYISDQTWMLEASIMRAISRARDSWSDLQARANSLTRTSVVSESEDTVEDSRRVLRNWCSKLVFSWSGWQRGTPRGTKATTGWGKVCGYLAPLARMQRALNSTRLNPIRSGQ